MPDATTAQPTDGTGGGTIISGLIDFFNSISGKTGAQQTGAAAAADPFASQRRQYQTQLLDIMKNTSSIFSDPAFQAAESQGMGAISRQFGAQGMGGSGNKTAELFKYGTSFGLDFFKNQRDALMQMAGVNAGSPGTAGAILAGSPEKTNSGTAAGINSIMQLLQSSGLPASIINAIKGAMGLDTSTTNTNVPDNTAPNYPTDPNDPRLITDPPITDPPITDPPDFQPPPDFGGFGS